MSKAKGTTGSFALIVVLFILLIIIGTSYVGGGDPVVVGFFPVFPFFWW